MFTPPTKKINPTGVNFTFVDSSFIPDSRKKVFEDIKLAIQNNLPSNTSATSIIGNWGEGKTYLFENYIPILLTEGQISYKIPTKTILNHLRNIEESDISDDGERLLLALFKSISDYNYESDIFQPDSCAIESEKEWLKEILNRFQKKYSLNIFFLIDEFEEIITERNNPELQNSLLGGLKSSLNEDSSILSSNPGYFHFFINCTPSAYYQIERDPNFNETFGGIIRRIQKYVLPKAKKSECFDFISKLFEYAWDGTHPKNNFLEFSDAFTELFVRLGLQNFGFIQSLISRICDVNRYISHEMLCDLLKETNVVHDVNEAYIKRDIYSILSQFTKDIFSKDILDFFITHYAPFTLESANLSLQVQIDESALDSYNKMIYNYFNKSFYLRVKKVNPAFGDVESQIKNRFKDENFLKITEDNAYYEYHGSQIEKAAFEDMLTYHSWDEVEKKTVTSWFIPLNEDDFFVLFPEFSKQDRQLYISLIKLFEGHFEDEEYVLINPYLLDSLFPTIIPPELNFIEDSEQRTKLWRDIEQHFEDNFKNFFFQGIINLFSSSILLEFQIQNNLGSEKDFENIFSFKLNRDSEIKYNIIFAPYNRKIMQDDILELKNFVISSFQQFNPINMCLLFLSEPLSSDILESSDFKELSGESSIYPNYLVSNTPNLLQLKEIIFLGKLSALSGISLKIDEKKRIDFTNFLFNTFKFQDSLQKYREYIDTKGFLIPAIKLQQGIEFKTFSKFYHQIIRLIQLPSYDPDEFFPNYEKVRKLKKFSGGTKEQITYADFSENDFKKYIRAIKENFSNPGSYNIEYAFTKIEESILQVIKHSQDLATIQNLRKIFYDETQDENIFNFYIEMLEFKGKITYDGELINYHDILQDKNAILESVEDFKKKNQSLSKNIMIYHYCNRKERELNIITLSDYIEVLTDYQNAIESNQDPILKASYLLLVNEIMSYYESSMKPSFQDSLSFFNKATSYSSFSSRYIKLKEEMEQLYAKIKEITKNAPDIEDLKEYNDLIESSSDFYDDKSFFEGLNDKADLIAQFDNYDDDFKDKFFFRDLKVKKRGKTSENDKLLQIANIFITRILLVHKPRIDAILEKYNSQKKIFDPLLKSPNSNKQRYQTQLSSLNIRDELKISSILYNRVFAEIDSQKIEINIDLAPAKSFEDITQILIQENSSISSISKSFDGKIDALKNCILKEENFLSSKSQILQFKVEYEQQFTEYEKILALITNRCDIAIAGFEIDDTWTLEVINSQFDAINAQISFDTLFNEILDFFKGLYKSKQNKISVLKRVSNESWNFDVVNQACETVESIIKSKKMISAEKLVELSESIKTISEQIEELIKTVDERLIKIFEYIERNEHIFTSIKSSANSKEDITALFGEFMSENDIDEDHLWELLKRFGLIQEVFFINI
jgi:hypothetical protein